VAGGCGDVDGVALVEEPGVDDVDVPAGHFADLVAAGAGAAPVFQGGGSAVAVPGDVVDVADRPGFRRV
jgi:hypothetical protein